MSALPAALVLAVVSLLPPAHASTIQFSAQGFSIPSNCTPPLPPQPACIVFHIIATATGSYNSLPIAWNYTADGQNLFGAGSATWYLDDTSPNNNDLFGTFTNTLTPPDANGIATTTDVIQIAGGSGIFAGARGYGNTVAFINAAPPSNPLGAFTETGVLVIPEPSALALLLLAAGVATAGLRRRPAH
jgi:hypothetical protein